MLQVHYYALVDPNMRTEYAIMVALLPILTAIIIFFARGAGVLGLGIQIFGILAQAINTSPYPSELEAVIPKHLLMTCIAWLGGIFCLFLDQNGYKFFFSIFSTACGAAYILEGLSCFFPQVPVLRPFDQLNFLYQCQPSSTSATDLGIYYAVVFGGAIIGLILQAILAGVFAKVKYARTPEKAPEIDDMFAWKQTKRGKSKEALKSSQWHFIRHSGENLSFRTHLRHLRKRLDVLHLKDRSLTATHPYADDSQYVALADQVSWIQHKNITPAEIHERAIAWLREKTNWDLLVNQPNDLFEMKALNREEWCNEMKIDPWGDFITLQAVAQVYQHPIFLVSSIWDPPVIEFPVIYQKKKKTKKSEESLKALKIGVKYVLPEQVHEAVPPGVVTLVGADKKAVRVDKEVVLKSTTIADFINEAESEGTSVIQFNEDATLTGEALFRICKQLEAFYIMETNEAAIDEIEPEHLRLLAVNDHFGKQAKMKGPAPVASPLSLADPAAKEGTSFTGVGHNHDALQFNRPIMLTHYWGFHYGSLEQSRKALPPTVLPSSDTQMRTWTRSYTRIAVNRVCLVLVIFAGLWWIIWQVGWGYRYDNAIIGIEFTLFLMSETTNFFLMVIYNFNFWNPIIRRWKSLDKLSPVFKEKIIVNTLVFHYSEDVHDTQRTIDGALRMKATENCRIRVYVCDDGFWVYPPSVQQTMLQKQVGRFSRIKNMITRGGMTAEEVQRLKSEGLPTAKSDYLPMFGKGEEELLTKAKELYRVWPKNQAKDMLAVVKQTMYRYYSEKLHTRVNIACRVNLRCNVDGEIVRGDCARGTIAYYFSAEHNGRIAGPECIVIGRIKPEGVHHYKAGNINNALFNERVDGEFAIFLDNDMKPLVDFVVRTVPWFYYYNELEQRYRIHKGISFIQSPQFFKEETIGAGHDFLGGRNGVFFQGIQLGRDGYDLCAFAGTNAIFRLRALHTVGGLPYGSLTEDAHLAICLHRMGYRSVYVEDRLAVGIAPVTVANSMQQRSRWVKGSVQIFLLYTSCGPKEDHVIWEKENPFELDTPKDLLEFGAPPHLRKTRSFFRVMFFWDTMMYPFSAITAIFYMIVALIFLITGEPPIDFTRAPFDFKAFLYTFLPYFLLKFMVNYLSYNKVKADDIWVSQEIWFGYSFASLIGVIDAFKEQITGKSLGGWGVTGEGKRSSNLEWFNLVVCLLLTLIIIVRFVVFLLDPRRVVSIAAIFFAITIVIQMWPMVSTSLYEYLRNAVRARDELVDLHRFEIPNYVIFTGLLIGVILISVFAIGSGTINYDIST